MSTKPIGKFKIAQTPQGKPVVVKDEAAILKGLSLNQQIARKAGRKNTVKVVKPNR